MGKRKIIICIEENIYTEKDKERERERGERKLSMYKKGSRRRKQQRREILIHNNAWNEAKEELHMN